MAFDKFLIAPLDEGLITRLRPWLIPDNAFAQLNNAYQFRGRVRKRFGSYLMNGGVNANVAQQFSRLRIKIGTTAAVTGNLAATIVPGAVGALGQMFSVGNTMFTVFQANGATFTTGAATATFNTATGTIVVTGNNENPATDVFWYPALPVMGLRTYELEQLNDESIIGFDTRFSYQWTGTAWNILDPGVFTQWSGTDSQFHWSTNYRGATADVSLFFVVNHVPADGIRYWNGTVWATITPTVFISGGNTGNLLTSRIIVPFKDRLVLLNVYESVNGGGAVNYANRCRFSQTGSPLDVNAFREDIPGRGGFIDAPTKEIIVSAEFVKDRLIVYFEASTWELAYTGNETLPFVWQKINTELGVESTFSIVPFDKVALGVGNVGIHACNGANTQRIDEKIPDTVFDIHNGSAGVERVYGIRDYPTELVYWTFPSSNNNPVYPNRVLVFNYNTGTWAFNDDSITCFGYFQPSNDATWQNVANLVWQGAEAQWNDGVFQSQYRKIVAGNQEGFVFVIDPFETPRNAPSLQITNITFAGQIVTLTVFNHNLTTNDFIIIENVLGITGLTGVYQVFLVVDANTIQVLQPGVAGVYTGAGTIGRVSRIDILTKQYNFYTQVGKNFYTSKVDFLVDRTTTGEVTVDYFSSSSGIAMVEEAKDTESILGTSVLETSAYDIYPFELSQDRLWHPVYLQSDGEVIQLRIYFSDDQLVNTAVSFSDFELHAMLFHTMAVGRLQ